MLAHTICDRVDGPSVSVDAVRVRLRKIEPDDAIVRLGAAIGRVEGEIKIKAARIGPGRDIPKAWDLDADIHLARIPERIWHVNLDVCFASTRWWVRSISYEIFQRDDPTSQIFVLIHAPSECSCLISVAAVGVHYEGRICHIL